MSTIQQRQVGSGLCGNIMDWRRNGYPKAEMLPVIVHRALAMRDFREWERTQADPLATILDSLSEATGEPAFIGDAR